jgi:hypothetical protein
MTETEEKAREQEEPDTPIEELNKDPTMADVVALAAHIGIVRVERQRLEEEEDRLKSEILPLLQMKGLHGVRTANGTAVRRTWTTSQSKIDPAKLREVLADAPNYIRETVDAPALKRDYESVWRQMTKAKSKETIAVRLPTEKGS